MGSNSRCPHRSASSSGSLEAVRAAQWGVVEIMFVLDRVVAEGAAVVKKMRSMKTLSPRRLMLPRAPTIITAPRMFLLRSSTFLINQSDVA